MSLINLAKAAALSLGVALFPFAADALPGLTERVVSDPATGVALYGYDPVAYFTEGRPVRGRSDVETEWNGAAWRFASEANRAAFLSAPEVYAPRFGGYDPAGVARGLAVAGHPLLFRVERDRLYLFRSRSERDAFAGPGEADVAWPKVAAELVVN
ncbi:YHS domain-containing (seleno)protein [Hansschlegelia zhihuaiae]|uniref:YHS domain-containing protein n=1 Tax=Hansschlegelia zhihuaiae TaxID=405005 RepID=A0A4Q0MND8_9HYPH|nr:YHS domain-containing (seleno)protein [Hansschlegelia zhihuaiae]RXF75381.1 YHS domain-containing protein [Hansschlegelia zhihuaiae]